MFNHLKQTTYNQSTWSGGTTTEMAIFPADAIYKEHDFLWRLSSATIDLDESDFTALPNYNRFIASLSEGIELLHNGNEKVSLKPLQIHYFDGGVQTKSFGKCVDFNLMLRKEKCDATIELISEVKNYEIALNKLNDLGIIYVVSGSVSVKSGDYANNIGTAETLMMSDCTDNVVLDLGADTKLYFMNIKYL